MKKVIILPLDGFPTGQDLLMELAVLLGTDIANLIAYIKINDGVHNQDFGGPKLVDVIYEQVDETNDEKLEIFLDLKIFDVSITMLNVLKKYLSARRPGILTISSSCSVEGIATIRKLLPNTKLAMVSALTDISAEECQKRFGQSPAVKIFNDLMNIRMLYQEKYGENEEPFDLVVCSAHELGFLKKNLPESYGFIVPGIRDEWMTKPDEHQKRIIGAGKALEMGATYLVMGAQLTKGNPSRGISAAESRLRTMEEIKKAFSSLSDKDPLEVLKGCGGYYKSPIDGDGKPIGPLVAYAGSYDFQDGDGVRQKNFVGLEYFNFAKAEEIPAVRKYFAGLIARKIRAAGLAPNVVIGAPMGGIVLGTALSDVLDCTGIFGEKKVTALADPGQGAKEKSHLIIDRHSLKDGDQVALVEDVCNNFSTTSQAKQVIESRGAQLVAIVCAFNRSGKAEFEGIPVIAAHEIPTQQFKQEDEEVKTLVDSGNVIWKPKVEWDSLLAAMAV